MPGFLQDLYTHLAPNPALWLGLTVGLYLFGEHLYARVNRNPLFLPIIVAIAGLIAILLTLDISYDTYFSGAQFIHFLLGPATVVLAIPLFEQRRRLLQLWLPLTTGLFVGCITAIVSVITLGWLFGLSSDTILSMVPKSVTTPIAMGISEQIGGMPDLTACFVVITGISGSIIVRPIFRLLGIKPEHVQGFSTGLMAHGMGTSTAFQISDKAGAFSGLAMGLTAILTAFLAPAIAGPLMRLLGL